MKAFGLSFHGPCTFLIWWDFPSVSVSSLRLPKVNVLLDMLVWRTLRNVARRRMLFCFATLVRRARLGFTINWGGFKTIQLVV